MLHLEINVPFGCRPEAKHVAHAVASQQIPARKSSLFLLSATAAANDVTVRRQSVK